MFKTEEVQKELSAFGKYVVKQSRSMLTKGRHNDSKKLYNSIGFDLKVMRQSFSMSFFMQDYGTYQDEGVRGAYSNKKAPNSPFRFKRNKKISPRHFKQWAKKRGISPFAVARSVWTKGLKPTMFFTKPFEDAFLRLPEDVIEKFGLDVDEFLEQVTQGTD
tara:strand:+ start:3304 stop:3786 length:483 start_codon:yes stop_codon:yes gene_type:complete